MKKLKPYLFIASFIPFPTLMILLYLPVYTKFDPILGWNSKESFAATVLISYWVPFLALCFKKQIDPFNKKDK